MYDIVDCGPRNRFCTPFAVAHNCLGLGYGCGADKFKIVAKTMAGLDLDPAACKATVYDFRNNNPGITNLWAQHQYALSVSADQKDSTHEIELASGRILTYFNPRRVIDSKTGRSGFTVMFRKGENPRYVYGGLLCIAEGTPVLTDRGWVGIEDVLETDLVWDGQSWVEQDGPVCNGVADTVEAYGAFMTPDHSVLTEDGWKRASSSEGHTRAPCRIPYGFTPDWQSTWDRSLVGRRVRLWQARNGFCQTVGEVQKAGDRRFLRLQETGNFTEKSGDTRNVKTSGVCSMALDAGPLQSPHPSGVAKLRRAWDNSMYAMARIIRGFLGRYGFQLRPGAYAGSAGQQRGLYQSELCVAPRSGTEQKPAVDTAVAVSGGVVAGQGGGTAGGGQVHDVVVPAIPGPDSGTGAFRTRVYDLINCGPRHQFVIMTPTGPLIVHNCENEIQATARDLLRDAWIAVTKAGFRVLFTVHDEFVFELPKETAEEDMKTIRSIVLSASPWAAGCPLDVEYSLVDVYNKA